MENPYTAEGFGLFAGAISGTLKCRDLTDRQKLEQIRRILDEHDSTVEAYHQHKLDEAIGLALSEGMTLEEAKRFFGMEEVDRP